MRQQTRAGTNRNAPTNTRADTRMKKWFTILGGMNVMCTVMEQCAECEIHEVDVLTSPGPALVASILDPGPQCPGYSRRTPSGPR